MCTTTPWAKLSQAMSWSHETEWVEGASPSPSDEIAQDVSALICGWRTKRRRGGEADRPVSLNLFPIFCTILDDVGSWAVEAYSVQHNCETRKRARGERRKERTKTRMFWSYSRHKTPIPTPTKKRESQKCSYMPLRWGNSTHTFPPSPSFLFLEVPGLRRWGETWSLWQQFQLLLSKLVSPVREKPCARV